VTLTVVSFFACDGEPPAEWARMLRGLEASAHRVGCEFVCLTNEASKLPVQYARMQHVPRNLMLATIWMQVQWLELTEGPCLLTGADNLIWRDPKPVFVPDWDVMVTTRPAQKIADGMPPLNNGGVYIRDVAAGLTLYKQAWRHISAEWGGDQFAIARAVAPIPDEPQGVYERHGVRVGFAPLHPYNHAPNSEDDARDAFVLHFKGDRRKPMFDGYAEQIGC
jgi:hypothetical protein